VSDDHLLGTRQAAEALGIQRTKLYELLRQGAIKSVRIGKLRKFKPSHIREYIDSLEDAA
jgi:excisionase family DNA binding protein